MPTRSPGKVGRSTEPGALSYSNKCFQTEEQRTEVSVCGFPYFSINIYLNSLVEKHRCALLGLPHVNVRGWACLSPGTCRRGYPRNSDHNQLY
uniref:Uncharacterized protein n=1 Tax=Monopterus albus TaxID=43700 RepID=A0A3Q3JHC6_MONAL